MLDNLNKSWETRDTRPTLDLTYYVEEEIADMRLVAQLLYRAWLRIHANIARLLEGNNSEWLFKLFCWPLCYLLSATELPPDEQDQPAPLVRRERQTKVESRPTGGKGPSTEQVTDEKAAEDNKRWIDDQMDQLREALEKPRKKG